MTRYFWNIYIKQNSHDSTFLNFKISRFFLSALSHNNILQKTKMTFYMKNENKKWKIHTLSTSNSFLFFINENFNVNIDFNVNFKLSVETFFRRNSLDRNSTFTECLSVDLLNYSNFEILKAYFITLFPFLINWFSK